MDSNFHLLPQKTPGLGGTGGFENDLNDSTQNAPDLAENQSPLIDEAGFFRWESISAHKRWLDSKGADTDAFNECRARFQELGHATGATAENLKRGDDLLLSASRQMATSLPTEAQP